ncbi:MAG: hypothetical protein VYD08_07500 [Pseudomonadota bacterium]|nr:hypothetical protein [Pseudomonadota bacterium]
MSQKQTEFALCVRQKQFVITRNGHTMFLEDVLKEIHALQRENAELRHQLALRTKESG